MSETQDNPIPDPGPILAVHRAPDGWIAFAAGHGADCRNLFSIRADHLADMFPQVRKWLERDAYFSVNGFWRAGWGKSEAEPTLYNAFRRKEGLRYLNACFIDLDAYTLGLSMGATVGAVVDASNRGLIPPPSILAESGRGLWVFWLLRDANNPDLPQRAFPERFDLYCRVQRAIGERLGHLVADAADAVRVCRVPGSANSKSGRIVKYVILADPRGRGFAYTLGELRDFYAIAERVYVPKVRAVLDDPTRAQKQRAWEALQANRLRQFEALRSMRGGFREGCRNRAAMLYAHFLYRNGVSRADVAAQVEVLGSECLPRLSRSECRAACRQGIAMRTGRASISNATIADWLAIERDEAELLESWPAASWHRPAVDPLAKTTPKERRDARRRAIKHIVAEHGGPLPSVRRIQALLAEKIGIEAQVATIHGDLDAMNLRTVKAAQSVFSFSATRERDPVGPSGAYFSPALGNLAATTKTHGGMIEGVGGPLGAVGTGGG
jgi:hypothetical protein